MAQTRSHNKTAAKQNDVTNHRRTPNPPRIPVFYTLTKIHKPTPVGRPIISGCSGPTERISAFVDHLIQPIAQLQASYLKDTTHFINFIERIELRKSAIHVSMDVTIQKKNTTRGYYYCMPCIQRISPRQPSSPYQVFKRNA